MAKKTEDSKLIKLGRRVILNEAEETELNEYYKLDADFREDLENIIIKQDTLKQKLKENTRRYQTENPKNVLYHISKSNASKNHIEFNICLDDIFIPEYCPYIKCKITMHRGQGNVKTNATLDRIDHSKGYVRGNIRVISRLAKEMKGNATEEELMAFAAGILELHR